MINNWNYRCLLWLRHPGRPSTVNLGHPAILDDDESTLAGFAILGLGTFVEQTNPEPQIKWTLIDLDSENAPDTGDIYAGLDRFGRVKDNRWYNYDGETDVDRIQYGYDRASNRIWRRNVVAASMSKEFDELYTYDAVHRLKEMERGLLNNERTALTACGFAQCWGLDSTGNWQDFRQADTDCNVWGLEQARTANEVNEITAITNTVGNSWAQPAYSPAGNMTIIPQPADPSESYTATYDAWNRLVKMEDGEDTVSTYAYDGARRRILQITGDGLTPSDHRHFYYTDPASWQVLEERLGTTPDSADPDRQFVWNLRYIDGLLLRDRTVTEESLSSDSSSSSSSDEPILDERFYASQDANWNVTAVADDEGEVQQRYEYDPYGATTILDADFDTRDVGNYGWETTYAGYYWDTDVDLFAVRHRVYLPSLGIWATRDFLSYSAGDTNLLNYLGNEPLVSTDPFGLGEILMHFLGGLQLIGGSLEAVGGLALMGVGGISEVGTTGASSPASIPAILGGLALVGHGYDNASAGMHSLWTGQPKQTLTSQTIQTISAPVVGDTIGYHTGEAFNAVASIASGGLASSGTLLRSTGAYQRGTVTVYRGMTVSECDALMSTYNAATNTIKLPLKNGSPLGNAFHSIKSSGSSMVSTSMNPNTAMSFAQNSDGVVFSFQVPVSQVHLPSFTLIGEAELLITSGTQLQLGGAIPLQQTGMGVMQNLPNIQASHAIGSQTHLYWTLLNNR